MLSPNLYSQLSWLLLQSFLIPLLYCPTLTGAEIYKKKSVIGQIFIYINKWERSKSVRGKTRQGQGKTAEERMRGLHPGH